PPADVHAIGRALKVETSLPWLACFRDPWVTNAQGNKRGLLRGWWARRQEARVVAEADLILANTPRGQAGFQAAYPRHADKVVAVPNGFDAEFLPRAGSHAAPHAAAHAAGDRLVVLHAGEFYSNRDPRPLL